MVGVVTVDPPLNGPCSQWAAPADVAAIGQDLDALDPTLLDLCLNDATDLLYGLFGSLWAGECEELIRPVCRSWLLAQPLEWWQAQGFPYMPDLVGGNWYNIPLDTCCGGRCVVYDGQRIPRIELGQYPVTSATVKIDGVALDPAAYRIVNWRWLDRVDGTMWPRVNDQLLPDTQPGTFSVAITFGEAPPAPAVNAAAQLAAELTKFRTPGQRDCALPLRVTSVTKQGVSYSLANVMDILNKGNTGLYFVDLALQRYNPNRLNRPPRVLTPDIRGPRRLGV